MPEYIGPHKPNDEMKAFLAELLLDEIIKMKETNKEKFMDQKTKKITFFD